VIIALMRVCTRKQWDAVDFVVAPTPPPAAGSGSIYDEKFVSSEGEVY
jgi:hypothetical protein